VQANRSWIPPTGPLGRLSVASVARAQALQSRAAEIHARAADAPAAPSFREALRRVDVAVIAEVKRRSPSKGTINSAIDAGAQAAAYARGGASALSILTEPAEFGGTVADLTDARRATSLPLLKKDFHVDPIQVVEAKAFGASALLLIARALAPDRLRALADTATELGIEVLVEVRSESELEDAIAIADAVIGVNSRDLETLIIEPSVTSRLIALIPSDRIAIAESGITSHADVERVAAIGADAVLVGSAISAATDPADAVAALTGVARRRRAG
jgi:indole-3-glycerol phosphate synthase